MHRTVKLQVGILAAIGLLLLPLPLLHGTSTIINFLVYALIFLILAESFNFLTGYAGQISLGSAAFFGIGAYTLTVSLTWYKVPPIPSLLVAGAVPAVLSVLVALPLFRLKQDVFAIGTLGFALILQIIVLYQNSLGGPSGLSIVGVAYNINLDYYIDLISAVLIVIAIVLLLNSKFGFGLVSIREDEDVAESLGIPVLKYKVLAFALSSLFAGIAGGVYALYVFHVSSDLLGITWTVNAMVICIIGGGGTVMGPAVMSLIFVWLQNYLLVSYPVVDTFIYAILLIVVVVFLPDGLMTLYRMTVTKQPRKPGLLEKEMLGLRKDERK